MFLKAIMVLMYDLLHGMSSSSCPATAVVTRMGPCPATTGAATLLGMCYLTKWRMEHGCILLGVNFMHCLGQCMKFIPNRNSQ